MAVHSSRHLLCALWFTGCATRGTEETQSARNQPPVAPDAAAVSDAASRDGPDAKVREPSADASSHAVLDAGPQAALNAQAHPQPAPDASREDDAAAVLPDDPTLPFLH